MRMEPKVTINLSTGAFFNKIYKEVGLSKNEIAELNGLHLLLKMSRYDLTRVAPMSKNGLIELSQLRNMTDIVKN